MRKHFFVAFSLFYAASARADSVLLLTNQGSAPTCSGSKSCIYSATSDGYVKIWHDAIGSYIRLGDALGFRLSANCAALASPSNGDVCYDTGLSTFRFYSGGWKTGTWDDSLVVHKSLVETITGDKTFTGTNTIWDATIAAGGNWDMNSHKIQDMAQGTATGEAIHAGRTISTSSPLTGGGDLTTDRTLSITPGGLVYNSVTGSGAGGLGAATNYLTARGQSVTAGENALALATRTVTARNLYCHLGTAPGGVDTATITVRKNAADQPLTCTITGAGTSCNDTVNTFAVAAGDRLSMKVASSAVTAANLTCTVEETN